MTCDELIKILQLYPADIDVRIDNGIDIDPVAVTTITALPEQQWEQRTQGYGRKRVFTGKTILVLGVF